MKKQLLLLITVSILFSCTEGNKQNWPEKSLGVNEKLFLNDSDFVRIRSNIDTYDWAANLYTMLKRSVLDSLRPYVSGEPEIWREGFAAREAALYFRLSGDTAVLPNIKEALILAFDLQNIEKPLFIKGKNISGFWSWGMFRMGYLASWDLVKTHTLFEDITSLVNVRLDEIIKRGFEYNAAITRLGNTQFWGITNLGVAGFLRDNKQAIDTSINGQYGFKASLLRFRDKTFWPEPLKYDYGYVASAMHMLAEASKLNKLDDLYHYKAANGASFKKMMDGFVSLMLSNGALSTSGDGSDAVSVYEGKVYEKGLYFFKEEQSGYRTKTKIDLLYSTYNDPVYAWLAAKNQKRDGWDHNFWGWTALTNGIPIGKQQAPSAASLVYPEFGVALLRADTTEKYWGSDGLSAIVRNGASIQFHSHNNQFALEVNAFSKQFYFDNFVNWDYLAPRKSRNYRNATPFTSKLIAHNSVTIDFKEPDKSVIKLERKEAEIPGAKFSKIHNSGPMQILTTSGSIYSGVEEIRTVGVTKEYVLDIFQCISSQTHNYDYSLHSFGTLLFDDNLTLNSYNLLNQEYELLKIDKTAKRKNNAWFINTYQGSSDSTIKAIFMDTDTLGMCVLMVGEKNTKLLKTQVPYYVSGNGWDEILPAELPERKPMLIVRRNCDTAQFVALHIPFKEKAPEYRLSQTSDKIIIQAPNFTDEYLISEKSLKRTYHIFPPSL